MKYEVIYILHLWKSTRYRWVHGWIFWSIWNVFYCLSTKTKVTNSANVCVGASIVLDIIDGIPVDKDYNVTPLFVFVQKFFHSFPLIDQCSIRNISIIGTLSADCMKEAPILTKKNFVEMKHAILRFSIPQMKMMLQ